MPTMTTCIMDSKAIDVREALYLRDHADNRGADRPGFTCIECTQPVRAHNAGGEADAHFEHLDRNPACSLSHK